MNQIPKKPGNKIFVLLFVVLFVSCSPQQTQPTSQASLESISFANTIVSLTFDDGDADNYSIRSVLAENDLHATFYVVSGLTGTKGYMTVDQLQGLYNDGNEIGGHTLNHTSLSTVRGSDLKREICQDRLNLLALGFHVTSFAYPFGYHDAESTQTVKDCGYNSARTVADGPQEFPIDDPLLLKAMPYVVTDTSVAKITRYVKAAENGKWSILVFHHVCDNCDTYSIGYDAFVKFAEWLGYQQTVNGLKVKTVNEVIGGEAKPGVSP